VQELTLTTTGQQAHEISEWLLESGALAITLTDAEDNPIFEPEPDTLPLWPFIKLTALFSALPDTLLLALSSMFADHIQELNMAEVPEQDWVRETQRQTQPICFEGKLWIYPSWHAVPAGEGVKLLLDPGLAFGTGSHATTSLMLGWIAQHPPQNLVVLDYGCGSGILAIAAALSEAKQVWCTDIDPQALLATTDNAERNHLSPDKLTVALPEQLPTDLTIDLILANILAEPLQELAPSFANYLKSGGYAVLSGILNSQVEKVIEIYQPLFTVEDIAYQDDWARLVFTKK
jgi:ribosomal protein L11 methyltransferase